MSFAQKLVAWQRRHGRRGLPWQGTRDPYRIWVSEIMLQQTQVATVIPYYKRFIKKYPSAEALAAASEDEVLRLWSGLGYYARGRNLLRGAKEVVRLGAFPDRAEKIAELPGIGRSTAAAIAVFAFGERAAILDGNVKRVLARRFGIEQQSALWARAEKLLPKKDVQTYTQALMDLGATVCTRVPACRDCPVRAGCIARKTARTAELPARRPRKALPVKTTDWFVCLHDGKVLLERRPAPGVWGGLWCFPEKKVPNARVLRELPLIEHGFTHFRLNIRPVLCEARQAKAGAWFELRAACAAAVPAPVRRLLLALR